MSPSASIAEPDADGQWLRRLQGSGRHHPASGVALVAEVTQEIGDGALRWAVDLGHQMATRIIAEIPPLGRGAEAFETLRMGTESATLRSMLLLATNDPARIGVTDEALEGDRDFVRRGIRLDEVLRGIRLGHSLMAHGFLEAAAELVEEPLRSAEMKRTSDLLFDYIDDFASSMAAEYLAERDRWVASAAAEREEMVRAILDGDPVSAPRALSVLGYPLDNFHTAFVLWRDGRANRSPTDLQRAAVDMLQGVGCSGTLMVPQGASTLWVWAAWRSRTEAAVDFSPMNPAIARAAVGTLVRGVEGFRRTHHEARHVARLVRDASPGRSRSGMTHFRDVELAVLLTQDRVLAENFARDQLGPLLEQNASAVELRTTVASYLANDRSLAKAADELHVARNTVAYRVKKFENITGRDTRTDRLKLEAALAISDFIGGQAAQRD